jgi:hypothetical protein
MEDFVKSLQVGQIIAIAWRLGLSEADEPTLYQVWRGRIVETSQGRPHAICDYERNCFGMEEGGALALPPPMLDSRLVEVAWIAFVRTPGTLPKFALFQRSLVRDVSPNEAILEKTFGEEVLYPKVELCPGLRFPKNIEDEYRFLYLHLYLEKLTEQSPDTVARLWKTDFRESLERWNVRFQSTNLTDELYRQSDAITSLLLATPRMPETKQQAWYLVQRSAELVRLVVISRTAKGAIEAGDKARGAVEAEFKKTVSFINFTRFLSKTTTPTSL